MNALLIFVVETLCMFEVWFPTTFFDFMTHLVIHLVDELTICGPISTRWCYPIERYLNVLNKYVHNKVNTKGCIAFEYMYDEVFGFCTKYFAWYFHTRCQMWDAKEEEVDVWEVLIGKGKHKKMTLEELKVIHEYIIMNSTTTKVTYMYSHYEKSCPWKLDCMQIKSAWKLLCN
jgi:hypothetical protein